MPHVLMRQLDARQVLPASPHQRAIGTGAQRERRLDPSAVISYYVAFRRRGERHWRGRSSGVHRKPANVAWRMSLCRNGK
jgi:hypothetical protein